MTSSSDLLPPALFSILSGLIEERTGLHYTQEDNAIFSSKVSGRLEEARFASALDYYYFLRYDDPGHQEFDALVDALVVGETYFHRELEPLRTLCDDWIAPKVAEGKRVRVWCAASSSGEEPLSLAMLLAERGILHRTQIVATDISLRALERARQGRYAGRSLRAIDPASKERWLDEADGKLSPKRELAEAIDWRRVNLVNADAVEALGQFDVILCRNVLIYFSEQTVQRVAAVLTKALAPGGVLLVGASESLLRFGTGLFCEERGGSFFYRRTA